MDIFSKILGNHQAKWTDLLGEYVENSILGMDKEDGSYYLKYLKKIIAKHQHLLLSILYCISSIYKSANSSQTVPQ